MTRIGSIEAAARTADAAAILADVVLQKAHNGVRAALANDKAARDSCDAAHTCSVAANAAVGANNDASREERAEDFEARKDPTGHTAQAVKRNPLRTWIERTTDIVDAATAKRTP